jgi:polyisoprenoid-binding protein YceI
MAITAGSYTLGPEHGTLLVHTKKGGAAARAGHDLRIEVSSWSGTFDVGEAGASTSMSLNADSSSLKVVEGTGGITSLGDDDKAGITQTINEEVLKATPITFRSTTVDGGAGSERLTVQGELELAGTSRPITFELSCANGLLRGTAAVKQTDFGMKPYSALFGTLKVLDEVLVEIDVELPAS